LSSSFERDESVASPLPRSLRMRSEPGRPDTMLLMALVNLAVEAVVPPTSAAAAGTTAAEEEADEPPAAAAAEEEAEAVTSPVAAAGVPTNRLLAEDLWLWPWRAGVEGADGEGTSSLSGTLQSARRVLIGKCLFCFLLSQQKKQKKIK